MKAKPKKLKSEIYDKVKGKIKDKIPKRLSDLKMSLLKRSEVNKIRNLLSDPTLKSIEKFSLAVYLKSLLQDEKESDNK